MRILDSYIDTYEKRKYLIYILIVGCAMFFSMMHILLGIQLLPIQSYDDVLSLVDRWVIQQSYFGRNALELLNIQVLNISGYAMHLLDLKLFEWIYFVGNSLCLFTSKKRMGYYNFMVFLFVYFFLVIMFLLAIHSGSLCQVMVYIRAIGIGMILVYGISLVIQLKEFVISIMKYIEALKIEVVIID